MAADFSAVAQRLEGRALRELVRPWLHAAVLDKHTRTLRLSFAAAEDPIYRFVHGPV